MLKRRFTRLYWRIGEVAEITGISQQTLRAWEQELAILRPRRDASGVRVYRERDFRIVLVLQQLIEKEKWSVGDVKELLVAAPDEIRAMINAVPPEALEGTPDENEPSAASRMAEKAGAVINARQQEKEEPPTGDGSSADASAPDSSAPEMGPPPAGEPGSAVAQMDEIPAAEVDTTQASTEAGESELAGTSTPALPPSEERPAVVEAIEVAETAEPAWGEERTEEPNLGNSVLPETEETPQGTAVPALATDTPAESEPEFVEAAPAAEPVVEASKEGDVDLAASARPFEGEENAPAEVESVVRGVPVAAGLMEQPVLLEDQASTAEDVSPTAETGHHADEVGREQVLAAAEQSEPSIRGEEIAEETAGAPAPGEATEEIGMAAPVWTPVEAKDEASMQEEPEAATPHEASPPDSELESEPELEESGEKEHLNQPVVPEVAAEESEPSPVVQPWDGAPVTDVAETPPSTSTPEPEPLPSAMAITWEAESEIPAEAAETAAQVVENVSLEAPEIDGVDKTRDSVASMAFPPEQSESVPEMGAPSAASVAPETEPREPDIKEQAAASTLLAMPAETQTEFAADEETERPLPERREIFELIASEAVPVPETLPKPVVEELRALREELAAIAEMVRMLVDPSLESTDGKQDVGGERTLAQCSSGDEKSSDA